MNIDLHLVDDSQNTVLHIIFFDIQKLEEKVNGRRTDPLACTCSATDLKNSTFYIVGFASHSSRLYNGLKSDLKVQLHGRTFNSSTEYMEGVFADELKQWNPLFKVWLLDRCLIQNHSIHQ